MDLARHICLLAALIFTKVFSMTSDVQSQELWWKELKVGILPTGPINAITDVEGVKVGQVTLVEGEDCRTGVTVILPHEGNIFQEKVPAAVYVANGFGKLTGFTQVEELGNLETPIVLTNTLSVPVAAKALIEYTLQKSGNESERSVNPVVGETNDGFLNNIRAGYVQEKHIIEAIRNAAPGPLQEGNVGAGTGTICFGFKGGIGSSSRKLPRNAGGYTVGVIVQTNFDGILKINGAPVGEELQQIYQKSKLKEFHDGSCMVVAATDAPLDARQLRRLAKRAYHGLARTGGISSQGSGEYVIAFSTAAEVRYSHRSSKTTQSTEILRDDRLSHLFLAAIEATEEAIYHSLFAAEDMSGYLGNIKALPKEEVKSILKEHNLYKPRDAKSNDF